MLEGSLWEPNSMDFEEKASILRSEVEKIIKEESNKPFIVSIMGQTGVGKSSLLNALFEANLPTDKVRPCTKTIDRVVAKGTTKHELWFYDLPGIGESSEADDEYLEDYKQKLLESDVVLWAIHADIRSVTFDFNSLQKILASFEAAVQGDLLGKITFVLTKADLLSPPPWIFGKDGESGLFTASKETKALMMEKSSYYQEIFLQPHADLLVSKTYNDGNFSIADSSFSYDEYSIAYHGLLTESDLQRLKAHFPEHEKVFDRLYDNYQFISCSSMFKYNLGRLMLVIINKLGKNAINRFTNFIDSQNMGRVPLSEAKKMSNIVIFDSRKKQIVFDLTDIEI